MNSEQKAWIERVQQSPKVKVRTVRAPESKPENKHSRPRGRYAPVTPQRLVEMRRLDGLRVKRTDIAELMNLHPTTVYNHLGPKRKQKKLETVLREKRGLK